MASFGSTPSLIVAAGVGAAAATALEPAFEIPRQEAWKRNANRILDMQTLAFLVAQGAILLGDAEDEANRQGFSNDKLNRLIYSAQTLAPEAQLMLLWRYGIITDAVFEQGLIKLGRHPDWIQYVLALKSLPLTGEILAVMLQRGVIPNQGQLPVENFDTTGNVPTFPIVPLDAYKQAAAYGMSQEQLDAYTHIQGLPPGMDLVARGVFRGIYTQGDFNKAAEQSNRRVEWAPTEFEVYREIPTSRDFAELELRGYLTQAERYAGTDRHGMSHADSDLYYEVLGRALGTSAITRALARGGTYDGTPKTAPVPWLPSLQRGNMRPEYYDLAYHYYEYEWPNYFVIKPLATAGEIPAGMTNGILLALGWRPDLCVMVTQNWTGATLKTAKPPTTYAEALDAWEGGTATTADPYAKKAETQLWTTTHTAYKDGEIGQADAAQNLTVLGVSTAAQTDVFKYWNQERATIRKQLSPAQVKKAYADAVLNPATGVAWTETDAITALVDRGYSQNDALTLLAE